MDFNNQKGYKKPIQTREKFDSSRSRGVTPSRRLVKPMKGTGIEIPAYDTLDLVGSKNPVVEVSSLGEKINAEGYQVGEQAVKPSVIQNNHIDPQGKKWKGASGGIRYIASKQYRDDFFSWKVEGGRGYVENPSSDQSQLTMMTGYDYKLVPSTDTYAYAQQFINLSKLMRNTQATYLPIAQAILKSVTMDCIVKDVVNDRDTSKHFEGYAKVAGITGEKVAQALNCDVADAMIYMFFMLADKDWSNICNFIERFCDAFFGKISILRQKLWNSRSVIDRMVQFTKRNAKTKPVELFLQKLAQKSYISGNYFNESLSIFNKLMSKRSGYSTPAMTQLIEYSKVHSIQYDLTGGSQNVWISMEDMPIRSGYAGYNTVNDTNFIQIELSSDVHSPLIQYIIQQDLSSIENLYDTGLGFINETLAKLDSKYGAIDSLLLTLKNPLGLKAPSFSSDIFKDQPANYSTLFESVAFSSVLRTVGDDVNQLPPWYYSHKGNTDKVTTLYNQSGQFVMEPQLRNDPAIGLVMRCPVNADGDIPTILQRNMCYRNLALDKWDNDVFSTYASGVLSNSFIVFSASAPWLMYYDTSTELNYAYDFDQFVNFCKDTFYQGTFRYKLSGVTLNIDFVSSYLYMDSTIAIIPNKNEVYELGTNANPIVKMAADLLLR